MRPAPLGRCSLGRALGRGLAARLVVRMPKAQLCALVARQREGLRFFLLLRRLGAFVLGGVRSRRLEAKVVVAAHLPMAVASTSRGGEGWVSGGGRATVAAQHFTSNRP